MLRPTTALPVSRSRRKLPRMSELAIDTADGGRIIDLSREVDAPARLPRGRAGGRYRCCACGARLIFSGPATAGSDFTPRFRHDGQPADRDVCAAPAPHQADVQADLTVVLDFRDQLASALPTASVCLHTDAQQAGARWTLPPALVLRHGDTIAVIERPRRLLTKSAVAQRLRAIRAQHGESVRHWWFFDRDDALHYDHAGTVKVQPSHAPVTHAKVRPTPVQRQIAAAGGAVCWIIRDMVLVPYGGHPSTYTTQPGEDWTGPVVSWARDWKISHPYPADRAAWWGLIPVHLLGFGTQSGFRPAPAFKVMAALARAESGREHYRRGLARDNAERTAARPSAALAPTAAPTPREDTTTEKPADRPRPVTVPPVPSAPPRPASPPRVTERRPRFTWRRLLPRRWRR